MSSRLHSISVVIPTYNRADLVREAIDSLLTQTRPAQQIIVIDDGSSDETPQILKNYGEKICIIQQANAGLAKARNAGLRSVTGDFIAFLDSDDWLPPTSLERRAAVLDAQPEIAAAYCNVQVTNWEGVPLRLYTEVRPGPRRSGMIFAELARYNLMPPIAYMVRKTHLDSVGGFFAEDVPGVEDYDLWLRLAARYPFAYIDEPLAFYRVHSNMMNIAQNATMHKSDHEVHRRIFAMPAFHHLDPAEKAAIYAVHGTRYAMQGDLAAARHWYLKAIRQRPFSPQPYLLMGLTLFGSQRFAAIAEQRRRRRKETFKT
ncbi:MAG: glycosyltransferase family 2 protein [Anaerolineae bacterium]|nr:glycosyltransferase family 2 protein [Anaerolineae bacterium]